MNKIEPAKADRSGRFAFILLEWVAGVFGLLFILTGLLFGRLAYGPLETDLLTPYIEQELSASFRGLQAHISQSRLIWDRDQRQLELKLEGTVLTNAGGGQAIAVPEAAVRVSALRLLLGRLEITDIWVGGANIALERNKEGRLAFAGVETLAEAVESPPVDMAQIMTAVPRELALLNDSLSHLRNLSVKAVQLNLVDRSQPDGQEKVQTVTLPDLELHRDAQGRLVGDAQLSLDLGQGTLVFNVAVNMLPADGIGEVQVGWDKLNMANLAGLAPELAGFAGIEVPLTGGITLNYGGNKKQSPILITLDLAAGEGSLQLADLSADRIPVKSAHAILTANASVAGGLESASVREIDINLDGPQITGTVDIAPEQVSDLKTPAVIDIDLAKGERRTLKVDLAVKDVPVDRLASLWPPTAAPGAREWVVTHLRDGMASEASFRLAALLDWPQLKNITIAELGGTIAMSGVTVDYLPQLPPITNTSATATFDASQMKIDIAGGVMNSVQVQPSTAVIDLVSAPEAITIEAHGKGPVPRILEAIDKPPLGYGSQVGIKPSDMQGEAEFTMKLAFPLLSDLPLESVKLGLDGTIRNFASDKLVSGLNLSGGTLIVALDTETMTLSGPLTVNGAAATVNWKEIFSPGTGPGSSAIVTTQLDNRLIENLGAGEADYIIGAVPLTVKYERYNQTVDTVEINGDLQPAGLKLEAINYTKPAGSSGKLNAKLKLPKGQNAPIQITALTASGAGLNLQGSGTLLQKPIRLRDLNITRGQFAGSSFTATMARLGDNGWRGNINASELNIGALRDPDSKKKPERIPPLDIMLTADRASFAPDKAVSPLKVIAKYNGAAWQQLEIELTARDTPFSFKLQPTLSGTQTLKVETPNLGNILRATDQLDTLIGGRLNVEGGSKVPGGRVEAQIDMRDFRIRDMPFIASLISAISAEGLLNALSSGEGLSFNRLRGNASWMGDTIELQNVKTSGGALGLTIEGNVNTFEETVALQGTAVPFNSVNSLLGNVPIVGQILGGSSGIFAATYTARGPFDDIRVGVNPLSILAPGFLRDLFFIEG